MNTTESIWGDVVIAPKTTGMVFGVTPLAAVLPPIKVSVQDDKIIITPKINKSRKPKK